MKPPDPPVLRADPLLHQVWDLMGRPLDCRVTGGYVRDRLLGRESNDLDLTIEGGVRAASKAATALAASLGVRAHLLGTPPHRIWRIETDDLKIEVWPLGDLSQEEDILRRDLSCNALSWILPDGPFVDLAGGLDDLRNRRLRAISRSNLESDPVRLLRAPRFLAQLPDFDLEKTTRGWIHELAPSLAEAPRERVGQELLTLLRGPATSRSLETLLDLDLFPPTAPNPDQVDEGWLRANLGAADLLARRPVQPPQPDGLDCGGSVPPAGKRVGTDGDAARLSFLFRAWGLPAERELAPYAWSKPVRENGLRAVGLLDQTRETVNAPAADRRELAWHAGSAFPALIEFASAVYPDHHGWKNWWRQWRRNPAALESPEPFLSGGEIAELAEIEPSPELGRFLRGLLRAQVRGEVRTRAGAERWVLKQTLSLGASR